MILDNPCEKVIQTPKEVMTHLLRTMVTGSWFTNVYSVMLSM